MELFDRRWTIEIDRCMVWIIEVTWIPPRHVLVVYKSCKPKCFVIFPSMFALAFSLFCKVSWLSWVFSMFYLAPTLEFNIVVACGVQSCCHFLATVGLYSARVYWFHLHLAYGLSITPLWFFRGLSLLCKAKASLLLVVLLRCRRVWRFVWAVCS